MRWGAALCLFALGCGAGGASPAVRAPVLAADAQLDWLPLPAPGWTIYGYVLDREAHQPVAGAAVLATDAASGETARVTTNGLGQFAFERLPAGRYRVTVVIGRARDVWPDVVLDKGKRTALRFNVGQARKIELDDRMRVRRLNRR